MKLDFTAVIHLSLITRSPSPRGYLRIYNHEICVVAFHRQSTDQLPCELIDPTMTIDIPVQSFIHH